MAAGEIMSHSPAIRRKGNDLIFDNGITVEEIVDALSSLEPGLQIREAGDGNRIGTGRLTFGYLENGEWRVAK